MTTTLVDGRHDDAPPAHAVTSPSLDYRNRRAARGFTFFLRRQGFGKRSLRSISIPLLAAWCGTCAAAAAQTVAYRPTDNAIHVTGFTAEQPATLDAVVAADRRHGWGKASYHAEDDRYRLDASLWIGTDDDWGTVFRIGSDNHPKVTLEIAGHLWVRPPMPSRQRLTDGRPMIANRLQCGAPGDPDIRPTILFDCQSRGQFGLFLGGVPDRHTYGGDLLLYHTTVSALTPDRDHAWRGFSFSHRKLGYVGGLYGHRIHVKGSTLSWVAGTIRSRVMGPTGFTWGNAPYVLHDSTFEHADGVDIYRPFRWAPEILSSSRHLVLYPLIIQGCVFRHLGHVDPTAGATFFACRFNENDRNLVFDASHRGAVLIDSHLGTARHPMLLPRSKARTRSSDIFQDEAGLDELATLIVQAVDTEGKPLPLVLVQVRSTEDASMSPLQTPHVRRAIAVTGKEGRTPSDPRTGALLVEKRRWRPTDDPAAPRVVKNLVYHALLQADGFRKKKITIRGEEAGQDRPLVVTLHGKTGADPQP